MAEKKNIIGIKKLDILIVAVLVVLCVLWFVLGFSKADSLTAEVYSDGELVYTTELNDIDEAYTKQFGGCTILFEKDGISFESSDCKNQLCVDSGKLTQAGATMACVPNKVVILLKASTSDVDIISY